MGKKRSHTDDVPHIPRAENAWILFLKQFLQDHEDELKDLKCGQRAKVASRAWGSLLDDEQKYWNLRGVEAKLEHAQKYPDYRFRPKKAAGKGKGKRKQGKGGKAQEVGGAQDEPPQKRRRMGESLTYMNETSAAVPAGEAVPMPSLMFWEESFASAVSSSAKAPPEAPRVAMQAPRVWSFATHDNPFTFAMPSPPTEVCPEYASYANATIELDANAFHAIEEYGMLHGDIQFAQVAYATAADDGSNTTYAESSSAPHYQAVQHPTYEIDANGTHDANVYYLSGGYSWPSPGGYEAPEFGGPSDYGTEECAAGDTDDGGFNSAAHYTAAVASMYAQDPSVIAEGSNEHGHIALRG